MEQGSFAVETPTYTVHRIVSFIGILAGLAGAIVFEAVYGRWRITIIAGMYMLVCFMNFTVAQYRVGIFKRRHFPKNDSIMLRSIGCAAFVIGLGIMLTYIALAASAHQSVRGDSLWIEVIWGALLTKSGAIAALFADKCSEYDRIVYPSLLASPNTTSVQDSEQHPYGASMA